MASVSVRPLADDNAQLNGLNLAPLIANGSRFSSSSASCGLSASMVDSSATGGSGSWRLAAIWTEKRGMASIFTSRRPDGNKNDARAGRYGTFAGSVDTLAVFLKSAK